MKIEITFMRRVPFVEMHRVDPPVEMLGFENFTLRRKVDDARLAGRYRAVVETIDTLAKTGTGNNRIIHEITKNALSERNP